MRSTLNPVAVDVVIAIVIAAVILVLEPGVAIAAILALGLLLVCGVSLVVRRRRPRPGEEVRARGR